MLGSGLFVGAGRVQWVTFTFLVFTVLADAVNGQIREPRPPSPRGELRIENVSVFGAYYSSALPNQINPGAAALPWDAGYGGGVQFSWLKFTERSHFSLTYAPNYTGRTRYTEFNALNHLFSFSVGGQVSRKWQLDLSGGASLQSQDQFLFSPTVFGAVSTASTSFDDLAAAMTAGELTNTQLASVLTGAPPVQSPATNLFHAERMFTARANTSAVYSPSTRLSVTFSAGADYRTPRPFDRDGEAVPTVSLVPTMRSANSSVEVAYSVSPRTRVGVTGESRYVSSQIVESFYTSALGSVSRTMRRHWFFELHGGVGFINPTSEPVFEISTTPQPVGGGSVGFRTFEHTLIASYDRTIGDNYGYNAEATSSVEGSWTWQRPGRNWWIQSSLIWQQLPNSVFDGSSLRGSAGFGRTLSSQTALLTEFSYLRYSGRLNNISSESSQYGVRVSIVWSPQQAIIR